MDSFPYVWSENICPSDFLVLLVLTDITIEMRSPSYGPASYCARSSNHASLETSFGQLGFLIYTKDMGIEISSDLNGFGSLNRKHGFGFRQREDIGRKSEPEHSLLNQS